MECELIQFCLLSLDSSNTAAYAWENDPGFEVVLLMLHITMWLH